METLTNETTKAIIDVINAMNCNELVQLNNEYCESINAMDSYIFENDEDFLETYFKTKTDVARAICYGYFRFMDKYVTFNGYGNLESFQYMDVEKLCELVPTMAEYIVENSRYFTQFDNI